MLNNALELCLQLILELLGNSTDFMFFCFKLLMKYIENLALACQSDNPLLVLPMQQGPRAFNPTYLMSSMLSDKTLRADWSISAAKADEFQRRRMFKT